MNIVMENNYFFGFVILNYNGKADTIRCVESLERVLKGGDYKIILVDNGSEDDSYSSFLDVYGENDRIVLLKNSENLGFSKGMNVGFKYAKEILKCDFISLINNDVEMLSTDFMNVCEADYSRYKFAVLGPQIIPNDANSKRINPLYSDMRSPKEEYVYLRSGRMHREIKYWCAVMGLYSLYMYLKKIKDKLNVDKFRIDQEVSIQNVNEVIEGVALHGSFLTFSPEYIQKYEGLEEVTFLYGEEWLLYNRCSFNGLKMIFDPSIKIIHYEHLTLKKRRTESEYYVQNERFYRDSRKKIIAYIKKVYGTELET